MQTLVQVVCNRRQKLSLRKKIARDNKLTDYSLICTEMKRNGRADGWSKLDGVGARNGVINIQWDNDTKTLSGRIITRGNNQPSIILSDFVRYIFSRHKSVVKAINIYPVE